MSVAIIGALIPIIAIIMGIGIGMLGLYFDFRKKREIYQLHHAERMAAIEKGIELPPLPPEFFQGPRRREPSPSRHRRIGLILLLLGIAMVIAMRGEGGRHGDYLWGLVPVALGLAFLISAWFESVERRRLPPPTGT